MRLIQTRPWTDPVAVVAGLGDSDWVLCLLSDGGPHGRWSYVMAAPQTTRVLEVGAAQPFEALRDLQGSPQPTHPDGPPFQGGVIGLAAYDLATPERAIEGGWPGLILARYDALLAFDHHERRVFAIAPDTSTLDRVDRWLADARAPDASVPPPAADFQAEAAPEDYRAAVADVVARIAAGELFQANVARAWRGRLIPAATPFDVFTRLAAYSPAPYAAWWRLPGRALVSNSPEAFVAMTADGRIETRPIKGTRPRGADPATDAALAEALRTSAKDRAENLMIVDLMRNDLSRVCRPGSVAVEGLFELERYANVQHLVSTVRGQARAGVDAADVMAEAFPPGSITGAPKHQAMKVIAGHEPPRGPWCGSLFAAGADGSLNASVLIRTTSLTRDDAGWSWRTLAGAGIVADSDPQAELDETDAKIAAIRRALIGG